jgi:hypothetical protein
MRFRVYFLCCQSSHTRLVWKFCELWPHFHCSVIVLACHCAPHLLVIHGPFCIICTSYMQQIFLIAWSPWIMWSLTRGSAVDFLRFWMTFLLPTAKTEAFDEHWWYTSTPWLIAALSHVWTCYSLVHRQCTAYPCKFHSFHFNWKCNFLEMTEFVKFFDPLTCITVWWPCKNFV